MPINNVCIQKRRLRQLTAIINKHTKLETLTPNGLNSYRQFNFTIPNLIMELVDELLENGFEIKWVSPKRDKVLVSVWMEVCPEKAKGSDKELIRQGFKTRDKINARFWHEFGMRYFNEHRRLETELESKDKSIQQLCKRVVDLKNEKEAIESGVNMFALFFDTVELINK